MFLKQNNKLQNTKVVGKSNWFVVDSTSRKIHIYEDIFIRRYVASNLLKWAKLLCSKAVGSIFLVKTFGKIYINTYYFYPISKKKKRKSLNKKPKCLVFFKVPEVKPILKYKKHLSIVMSLFRLEKLLGVQIIFRFKNICNDLVESRLTSSMIYRLISFLTNSRKLSYFKTQFSQEVYVHTIVFLVHLLKYKKPDGDLLASYISNVFLLTQEHTLFLDFLYSAITYIRVILRFKGVKVSISGKLDGFSRARTKQIQVGFVTLRSYEYYYVEGFSDSFTRTGKIGVKTWICH